MSKTPTMHIKTLKGIQQWRVEVSPDLSLAFLVEGTAGVIAQIMDDDAYSVTDVVIHHNGNQWAATIYGEHRP